MEKKYTSKNVPITSADLNRHYLVYLRKNINYADLPTQVLNHIKLGMPFVCARFDRSDLNFVNLGYCFPRIGSEKPTRFLFKRSIKDIGSVALPYKLDQILSKVPAEYSILLEELAGAISNVLLSSPFVYGTLLWQSISENSYVSKNSDFDFVLEIKSMEEACLADLIFNNFELKYDKIIDCEFKLISGIYVSRKELFAKTKSVLSKTKYDVKLVDRFVIYNNLVFAKQLSTKSIKTHSSETIALAACKALYSELICYPKPGLVSFIDSGSHRDMDYTNFVNSITSLYHFFKKMAEAVDAECSFYDLEIIGIQAENKIRKINKGLNTHNGAIFSLGILVAGTAMLLKKQVKLSADNIRNVILENWERDIELHCISKNTHGSIVKKKYNVGGLAKEAKNGFPALFNIALPAYILAYDKVNNKNRAMLHSFFEILKSLDDTNILYRSGKTGIDFVKQRAEDYLNSGSVFKKGWNEKALKIHKEFIKKQISPGGCADILACTVFISQVTDCL
jgi:triphosphoribosyl-dephospho-CoA synthase